MMIEVGFWRRLFRIIRANVNHYRYRPKKVKPIPIKVKSKPWVAPERVYVQPRKHFLTAGQEDRGREIRALTKPVRFRDIPIPPGLDDILANDIRTYQRAANRASIATNDPHNYYHRER